MVKTAPELNEAMGTVTVATLSVMRRENGSAMPDDGLAVYTAGLSEPQLDGPLMTIGVGVAEVWYATCARTRTHPTRAHEHEMNTSVCGKR